MRSWISPLPVFIVLVGFLATFASGGNFNFQGSRNFENACDGCVVSKGIGYQSFFGDCTCFYTCVLVMSRKLSSMASPYVSYKKCCGCGESFSKKTLSCVRSYDKRSDCFDENSRAINPCESLEEGDRLPRQKADQVFGDGAVFCSGFIECKNVSGTVVPDPQCCPGDDCFDPDGEVCTEAACHNEPACEVLLEGKEDDCECERTEAPESECQYMAMENSNVKFMHIQEMRSYDCPPATCWDQELCACVQANNTGYNDCEEYLNMDFTGNLDAFDARGAIIYSTVHGNVTEDNNMARFFGGPGTNQINVVGSANSWLSNTLVIHFEFTLEDDAELSSANENQCLLGNCKIETQASPGQSDTISVLIERDANSDGFEIEVNIEYQDKIFMNIPNSMGNAELSLSSEFDLDTSYEFWLIYCGEEEIVYAGVILGADAIAVDSDPIPGSVQIIDSQSGFLFGDCQSAENYEGTLDEVEIYKNCKPEDDVEFEEALEEILEELGADG